MTPKQFYENVKFSKRDRVEDPYMEFQYSADCCAFDKIFFNCPSEKEMKLVLKEIKRLTLVFAGHWERGAIKALDSCPFVVFKQKTKRREQMGFVTMYVLDPKVLK